MINLNYTFEKKQLNKEKNEELMLVELTGIANEKVKADRKKINVCLCIDISGSMGSYLKNPMNEYKSQYDPFKLGATHVNNCKIFEKINKGKTKLELAKEAAMKAIDMMLDGDIISIVQFDCSKDTIIKPTVLNKDNRTYIKNEISKMQVRGATDIHGGWVESIKNVAQNVSSKNLNRVILLTDGMIVTGERNPDVIAKDVVNMADKMISTSCFGVGEDFNEQFLQMVSDAGNGNFYFIDDDKNFDVLFSEEFTGLSNVVATNIKLKLKFENAEIIENLNNLEENKGEFKIQDLTSQSKQSILIKINTSNLKNKEKSKLGTISLEYIGTDGNKKKIEEEVNVEFVEKEIWEQLDENQELKVQEVLLTIAKEKERATEAFRAGNRDIATSILREASLMATSSCMADERLSMESNALEDTLFNANSKSDSALAKSMHYQAYTMRKGK